MLVGWLNRVLCLLAGHETLNFNDFYEWLVRNQLQLNVNKCSDSVSVIMLNPFTVMHNRKLNSRTLVCALSPALCSALASEAWINGSCPLNLNKAKDLYSFLWLFLSFLLKPVCHKVVAHTANCPQLCSTSGQMNTLKKQKAEESDLHHSLNSLHLSCVATHLLISQVKVNLQINGCKDHLYGFRTRLIRDSLICMRSKQGHRQPDRWVLDSSHWENTEARLGGKTASRLTLGGVWKFIDSDRSRSGLTRIWFAVLE